MTKPAAPTKQTLTLLTDDQGGLATGENERKFLKAHLVQQALTNTSVSVPDSFLINNANLRDLLRNDATVRGLVTERVLTFAVRDTVITHAQGLSSLATLFAEKGTLRATVKSAPSSDLRFVDQNASFIPWKMDQVASNYATLSRNALFSSRTTDLLGDKRAVFLQRLIDEDRGGVIDRNLILFEVEDLFTKHNAQLSPQQLAHLRLCVDAPYHSNLPNLLGLDPAYDTRTQASFDLMRGIELTATEIETAREMPDRLDAEHYIHGLSELPLDVILAHRESFEFVSFIKAISNRDDPDHVQDCFIHLDIAIQNAILSQYPDLHSRSSIVSKRKISKRVHAFRKDGVSRLTDIVSIGISLAGLTLPVGVGYCANHLLDYVRGHSNEAGMNRSIDDIAAHTKDTLRLKKYLEKKGLADKITNNQTLVETHSHAIETFVANT